MLLLSLAAHLAVILGVSPRPGGSLPYTQVISARIVEAPPVGSEPALPPVMPDPEVPPAIEAPPVPEATPEPTRDTAPEPRVEASTATGAAQPATRASAVEATPSRLPSQEAPKLLPSVPVMLDTTWYGSRQLDVQPKARQAIVPVYPETARYGGVEGTVTLLVRVDELGRVREVSVESATPPGVFDDSALAAFKAARFNPAMLDGRAVRAEVRIRVNYSLND